MSPVQETYLGWDLLAHADGCQRPEWSVEVRFEHDEFRARYDGPEHACPNEGCGHSDRYAGTTVRIVCRSCGTVHLVGAEAGSLGLTSTAWIGYGLPPRRVAGLWLWPAAPFLDYGRANTAEPHDFLVTATRVERVSTADVVGQIQQGTGRRGGIQWQAAAVPAPPRRYQYQPVHWQRSQMGLRTVTAAAKWIGAQAEEAVGGGDAQ